MSDFNAQLEKTARALTKKAAALEKPKDHRVSLNLSLRSVYGWQVAIPAVLGVFCGRLADAAWPKEGFSWTLNLILLGFVAGIINANLWLKRKINPPDERKK